MKRFVLFLAALDPRRAAVVLFGGMVIVGVVGTLATWLDPTNAWVGLDAELGPRWPPHESTIPIPAIWSALTMAFAGLGWLACGSLLPRDVTRAAAVGFGILLLGLAFDEVFIVHERLEIRTGVDWQLIYLPVAAVGAALLATLVWRLRHHQHGISAMLLAGGLCWAVAAALEYVQWRGDEEVEPYALFMIPEEMLELAGSAFFALAAIATVQSWMSERG